MTIEPTDADIAEAIVQNGIEATPRQISAIRRGPVRSYMAHATTLAKLRHAEELLAAQAAQIAGLREVLIGMVAEYDQQARYGSPMAKAANPRVQAARAAIKDTQP